ncbi:MAG TPA: hypothetical protein PK626_00305 [Bacteroidales bacterium]|nr:hypothetical protein [Bacteroidales bacterium]
MLINYSDILPIGSTNHYCGFGFPTNCYTDIPLLDFIKEIIKTSPDYYLKSSHYGPYILDRNAYRVRGLLYNSFYKNQLYFVHNDYQKMSEQLGSGEIVSKGDFYIIPKELLHNNDNFRLETEVLYLNSKENPDLTLDIILKIIPYLQAPDVGTNIVGYLMLKSYNWIEYPNVIYTLLQQFPNYLGDLMASPQIGDMLCFVISDKYTKSSYAKEKQLLSDLLKYLQKFKR